MILKILNFFNFLKKENIENKELNFIKYGEKQIDVLSNKFNWHKHCEICEDPIYFVEYYSNGEYEVVSSIIKQMWEKKLCSNCYIKKYPEEFERLTKIILPR